MAGKIEGELGQVAGVNAEVGGLGGGAGRVERAVEELAAVADDEVACDGAVTQGAGGHGAHEGHNSAGDDLGRRHQARGLLNVPLRGGGGGRCVGGRLREALEGGCGLGCCRAGDCEEVTTRPFVAEFHCAHLRGLKRGGMVSILRHDGKTWVQPRSLSDRGCGDSRGVLFGTAEAVPFRLIIFCIAEAVPFRIMRHG